MNFEDPLNRDELIEQLKQLETIQHVFNFINSIYPTWIVARSKSYSSDYNFFNSNWDHMIRLLKEKTNNSLQKEEIIIVKDIGLGCAPGEKILLRTICEVLTLAGFCIRDSNTFSTCSICSSALPTESFYVTLKEIKTKSPNISIPTTYSPNCTSCYIQDEQ